MLQKMERIQVIGPRKDLGRVVDVLYRAGTLHLEDAPDLLSRSGIGLDRIRQEEAEAISDVLGRISAILSTMPPVTGDPAGRRDLEGSLERMTHAELVARANEVILALETTTRDLSAKKAGLTLSITTLNRYARVLDIIHPVEKDLPALEGFEVTILLLQAEHREVLDLIRGELAAITKERFEMIATAVDRETIAVILVFPKKSSEEVHSFIYSVNVNEVRLPKEYAGRPFYEMYALLEEDRIRSRDEIARIDSELLAISGTWYQELAVLRAVLDTMSNELGAYRNFGVSEYTFVIMGWIPKKSLEKTRNAIRGAFGDRVVVNALPVTEKDLDDAPVFYDNPVWVRPFEVIMQLVAPPRYREIDPSPILAVFFPLFFGIMVGDIGYGLVILALALGIRYRFRAVGFARSLAEILAISAVPAIVFGFIFGEFFGNLGEELGLLHPTEIFGITLNRVDAMIPILVLAVAIGVVHVFLGLALGIRNAVILKKRKHLFEKAGMLLVISGILVLVGMLAGALPAFVLYPGVILMVAGMPMILAGAGAFGAIEVMSTVGNILSYSRLMAIGMASVILAMVANELGGAFGIALVGILVAVHLHALNIVLAMFSPSIHSVRLHLVEFFSKFYEGGGVVYRPFRKEAQATEQGK